MYFHDMNYMGTPYMYRKIPCPGVQEISNLVASSTVLSLSDLCLRVEKNLLKEIMNRFFT